MEQQIAMLLQQVMEMTDRFRQNEESSEQVRQLMETLVGVTGLECFVPGQDGFNEDECKKSSDQWRHDLEMRPL